MRPRLLLPVLLLAASATAASGTPTQSRSRFGDWTLIVRHDPFSGATSCRLTAKRMSYERGALVLHLPHDSDTSNVVYRIDGGRPITAEEDRPILASLGFSIWRDDLSNPSDGLVRIPAYRLKTAHALDLAIPAKHQLLHSTLRDFASALSAFRTAECDDI